MITKNIMNAQNIFTVDGNATASGIRSKWLLCQKTCGHYDLFNLDGLCDFANHLVPVRRSVQVKISHVLQRLMSGDL